MDAAMAPVAEAGTNRLPGGAVVPNGVAVRLRASRSGNFVDCRPAFARPPAGPMPELTRAYGGDYRFGQEG